VHGWYLIYTMVVSFKIHSILSLTDSNTDDTLVFITYLLNLVFFETGWIWLELYRLSEQWIQITHRIIHQYSCYLVLNIRETNLLYHYILCVKR